MTETINTAEVFKSRQNFSNFIEQCADAVTNDLLKDYPKRQLHIIYPQLTQISDGILDALNRLAGNQKAYIFWFIANEKEELKNTAITLNNYFDKNYAVFLSLKRY